MFTARDFAFDAPASLPSGPVTVTLRHEGLEEHHAIALRLNDGVTVEQFTAALPEGPGAALTLATLHGGPETADPGPSTSVTLDLTPGTYVFLCAVQGSEGVPHFAKGMIHTLDVTPSATTAPAPEPVSDVRVGLRDFSFALNTPPAGPQDWEIVNEGQQPHEMTPYTLLPGKTFDDLMAYAQDTSRPRPVCACHQRADARQRRPWLARSRPAGGRLRAGVHGPGPGDGEGARRSRHAFHLHRRRTLGSRIAWHPLRQFPHRGISTTIRLLPRLHSHKRSAAVTGHALPRTLSRLRRTVMTLTQSSEALVLRDGAGGWYLLRIEALVAAVATPDQQAALHRRFRDAGSGSTGTRQRTLVQVMGVVRLPLTSSDTESTPPVLCQPEATA